MKLTTWSFFPFNSFKTINLIESIWFNIQRSINWQILFILEFETKRDNL